LFEKAGVAATGGSRWAVMPTVLRWLIANLIVFVPLVLVILQVNHWYPNDDDWSWWVAALLLGTLVAAGYAAWRFWMAMDPELNLRDHGKSTEQIIAELEAKNLIRRDVFHARRAFQMEEMEDEGSNFFVDLEDGRVLFVSGQILYEYEPEEPGGVRRFPCTEFEFVCLRDTGEMLDLICRGQPLEPEVMVPAFTLEDFRSGWTPENLEIIDRSYDELKAERLKVGRG
jgi:hypothetical protein